MDGLSQGQTGSTRDRKGILADQRRSKTSRASLSCSKATTLGDYKAGMLRDAALVRTEPSNYNIFRSMQLLQFDGARNVDSDAVPRGEER